jgi:hypothetical protein
VVGARLPLETQAAARDDDRTRRRESHSIKSGTARSTCLYGLAGSTLRLREGKQTRPPLFLNKNKQAPFWPAPDGGQKVGSGGFRRCPSTVDLGQPDLASPRSPSLNLFLSPNFAVVWGGLGSGSLGVNLDATHSPPRWLGSRQNCSINESYDTSPDVVSVDPASGRCGLPACKSTTTIPLPVC